MVDCSKTAGWHPVMMETILITLTIAPTPYLDINKMDEIPPPDSDNDGVIDDEDSCPNRCRAPVNERV